ncbi:MAG: alpha/beta hydrolase [Myxococcota bacterium]|nr:alpha/beta hydrolase [Myxococcota bacterium]
MQESYLTINHLQICLCSWSEKPDIIFLHGWLDQAYGWEEVALRLKQKGHASCAYDQRGHGKSDHASLSSHYHFPDYVADLDAVVQTLRIPKVTLIAHSMGGTVASIYSALRPHNVAKLILIEGLGPLDEDPKQAFLRYQKHLLQKASPQQHSPFASTEEATQRILKTHSYLSYETAKKLASRLLVSMDSNPKTWMWRFDPRHKERSAIGFSLPRHLEILSRIQAPTYTVFGEKSWYLRIPEVSRRLDALSNHKGHYSLPVGHSMHYEHPTLLADTLDQILNEPLPAEPNHVVSSVS